MAALSHVSTCLFAFHASAMSKDVRGVRRWRLIIRPIARVAEVMNLSVSVAAIAMTAANARLTICLSISRLLYSGFRPHRASNHRLPYEQDERMFRLCNNYAILLYASGQRCRYHPAPAITG